MHILQPVFDLVRSVVVVGCLRGTEADVVCMTVTKQVECLKETLCIRGPLVESQGDPSINGPLLGNDPISHF